MGKNMRWIFHIVIIPFLLLVLSGCGHKADPYYQKKEVSR
ncbi:hypothetical protein NitYY0918_C0571 [Nitratiruptor sp. YY09-18]|nr:hypothetical protein NitYY0918_C0571 [Nitratiruptor sp. YY09-18]